MTQGRWWTAFAAIGGVMALGVWLPGWWMGAIGLAVGAWSVRRIRAEWWRFAQWQRHTSVGWVVTDLEGKVVWANPGFERLTGYPPATARGVGVLGLLDAIGAEPETLQTIMQRIRAGEPFGADVLALRRDGRRRWMRWEGDAIRDVQGRPQGMSVLLGDAEVRIHAVRGLQRGQAILRAVASSSEHLLRSPRWDEALPGVLEQLGRSSGSPQVTLAAFDGEDAVEQAVWSAEGWGRRAGAVIVVGGVTDVTPGEAWIARGGEEVGVPVGSAVAIVAATGRAWGFLALHPPGGEGWGEVDLLAFRSAAAAIGAAIDREEGEAALARERLFAERVLQGVVDGVAVIDASGVVAYANGALLRMVGRPREEVWGGQWATLVPPVAEVERDGAFVQYETVLEQAVGFRTLHVREVVDVGVGGEPRRIAVLSDVTDRKRLEASLSEAVAAARAANEAKTRFLGRVSHELRTPLNAMLGFAQLAGMDAATPEAVDAVRQIRRAGGHLERLIDDLIDVSSAETGDLRVAVESVDLSEVVGEAVRMIAPLASAAGVRVVTEVADGVVVRGDRRRMLQVALNLLDNAVRYADAPGRVSVRVLRSGRLEVEDDGIGIAPAEAVRLFTPFERLANARDRQGSGIGLALSRLLVERMGGRIGVSSALGVGSVFWVEWLLALGDRDGST